LRFKKYFLGALAFASAFLFAISAYADRDQGADNSKYQGYTFVAGQSSDKFGISQIGGIYSQTLLDQATYNSQIATGIAQAKRMHSYIWLSDGSDQAQTKRGLDYFLPKIQTPKGSIVAVDYESNATNNKDANTANIMYAMQRIKDAGYTPMLYTYKPFQLSYINLETIASKFGNKFVWIAGYPHSYVTTTPDYSGFPSVNYVAIWQFTDYYGHANGLDGNVDLLGVTNNGYDGTTKTDVDSTKVKTNSTTTAIKQGQTANATSKSDIAVGYTVKVNFSASKWSNGYAIPSWVKGKSYKVQQVSGSKVLLAGILSWIDKSNVEILQTAKQATSTSTSSSTLPSGVHAQSGYFTPNQRLMVWHGAGTNPTYQYYYAGESVKYVGYIDNWNAGYRYIVYKGTSGNWCYAADRHLSPNYMLGYAR
jgi:hypothetical protein